MFTYLTVSTHVKLNAANRDHRRRKDLLPDQFCLLDW